MTVLDTGKSCSNPTEPHVVCGDGLSHSVSERTESLEVVSRANRLRRRAPHRSSGSRSFSHEAGLSEGT